MENVLKFLAKVISPMLMIVIAIVQAVDDSENSDDATED